MWRLPALLLLVLGLGCAAPKGDFVLQDTQSFFSKPPPPPTSVAAQE